MNAVVVAVYLTRAVLFCFSESKLLRLSVSIKRYRRDVVVFGVPVGCAMSPVCQGANGGKPPESAIVRVLVGYMSCRPSLVSGVPGVPKSKWRKTARIRHCLVF